MLLSRPAFWAIDGDLGHGGRPSQRDSQFDPRWEVCFFWGAGSGPYGLQPYQSRGQAATWAFTGTSIGTAPDGWAFNSTVGAIDNFHTLSSGFNLNLTQGTVVIVTRLTAALSSSTAQRALQIGVSGTNLCELISPANANMTMGWSSAASTLVTAAKPTTSAGQLCVFAFSYSPTGTRGYFNGTLWSSNASVPSTANIAGSAIYIGGFTSAVAWGNPIYSVTFLDRDLSANEHAFIAYNPFTWQFQPSLLRTWDVLGGPTWGWENLSDMIPQPQRRRQLTLQRFDDPSYPFTATVIPTQTGWDVIPPRPQPWRQTKLPINYRVDEFPFTATITPTQTGWDVIPPRPQPRRQVRLQPPYPAEDFPVTAAVTPGPLGWLALDQFPLYRRQAPKVWYDADLSPPGAQQVQVLGYLIEDQPGRRPARLAPRWFLDDLPPLATAPQGWQVEIQFPPSRRLAPRWQQLAEEFIFTAVVTPQPLGWHADPLVPQPRRRNVQNYSPDENPFGVPITPAALGWHVDPLRPQAYRLVPRRWQEQDIWNVQVAVTPGPLGWQVEALLPLGKRVQIGWVLEPPESPQSQAVLTPGPLGWEPVTLPPLRQRPRALLVPDAIFDVVVVAPLVSHLPPPRYGLFHVLGRWLKR